MIFSGYSRYKENILFDFKDLFHFIRFIFINFLLVIIFLFLAMEEMEWGIFSSIDVINDKIIDDTSWNIKKYFSLLKF